MQRSASILVALFLIVLVAGCASRQSVTEQVDGRRIVYTAETGRFVAVSVGGGYVYESPLERKFRGVEVKGHLFKNADGSSVVVARMTRDEFEELVGIELQGPSEGVKAFPPRTIFARKSCELVRAYVATLEEDVVAAVKLKAVQADPSLCATWLSVDDVMVHEFELVSRFDESADEAVTMEFSP